MTKIFQCGNSNNLTWHVPILSALLRFNNYIYISQFVNIKHAAWEYTNRSCLIIILHQLTYYKHSWKEKCLISSLDWHAMSPPIVAAAMLPTRKWLLPLGPFLVWQQNKSRLLWIPPLAPLLSQLTTFSALSATFRHTLYSGVDILTVFFVWLDTCNQWHDC